jgi:hypothetical protein
LTQMLDGRFMLPDATHVAKSPLAWQEPAW